MKKEIADMTITLIAELVEDGEIEVESEISAESELYGDAGVLDSMALVSLILALEQAIEERFDKSVSLADEKALSQTRSPYRTVDSIAEYAARQIEEQ